MAAAERWHCRCAERLAAETGRRLAAAGIAVAKASLGAEKQPRALWAKAHVAFAREAQGRVHACALGPGACAARAAPGCAGPLSRRRGAPGRAGAAWLCAGACLRWLSCCTSACGALLPSAAAAGPLRARPAPGARARAPQCIDGSWTRRPDGTRRLMCGSFARYSLAAGPYATWRPHPLRTSAGPARGRPGPPKTRPSGLRRGFRRACACPLLACASPAAVLTRAAFSHALRAQLQRRSSRPARNGALRARFGCVPARPGVCGAAAGPGAGAGLQDP